MKFDGKTCFELFLKAYKLQKGDSKLQFPLWIKKIDFPDQQYKAKKIHQNLSCALIFWSLLKEKNSESEINVSTFFKEEVVKWAALLKTVLTSSEMVWEYLNAIRDACLIGVFDSVSINSDVVNEWHKNLHQYASNACNGDPEEVTPRDVVELMCQFVDSENIHAYALSGIGLLYGCQKGKKIYLVGDEFRNECPIILPSQIKNEINIRAPKYNQNIHVNKYFIELESVSNVNKNKSSTLLVNATKHRYPFSPGVVDVDNSIDYGIFNKCLNAGYEKVLVLVSNKSLTSLPSKTKILFKYLQNNGLKTIVQLPKGVVGERNKSHSLLIFESPKKDNYVSLINWNKEGVVEKSQKSFGESRRASQFAKSFNPFENPSAYLEESADLIEFIASSKSVGSRNKILSFEVGQLSKKDYLISLKEKYKFKKIKESFEIFRSSPMESGGSEDRINYFEVGASSINNDGILDLEKVSFAAKSSIEIKKRQILEDGDIVICFRGSEDSFAKAAIYIDIEKNVIAIPNQSLLIIRRKSEYEGDANLLLWWLRSDYSQKYLRQKAIIESVVRISPKDIGELEFPFSPEGLIEKEMEIAKRAMGIGKAISVLRSELKMLKNKAWVP